MNRNLIRSFSLPKSRLSLKLLGYVVLCSLLFALLTSSYRLYVEYQRDLNSLYTNLEFIENSYLPIIEASAFRFDDEHLRIELQSALQLLDIVYLEVSQEQEGEIYYVAVGNPKPENEIVRAYPLFFSESTNQTMPFGTLLVKASLSGVQQRLLEQVGITLVTNLVSTFLVTFVIFLIFQMTLTRHLTTMDTYAQNLNLDNLDQEIMLDRIISNPAKPDELDRLALTLNQMRLRLKEGITARKLAEKENRQLEAHLRQQQKLESIGTLAGGVAHEINNPITGIMNYAQLIHERLNPEQKQLREFAAGIGDETERVAQIVRNLLSFARQEKQSHSPANISDIMEGTLSLIRTIIRRDQITLEVDVPDDLPKLKCRSQQIQQVLMNLLTNARDALNGRYSEYDPNKIMSVTVRLFEKDGRRWLRTTVEDRGTGIPDEIKERLFDPFYTTKDRATGTGLGLSISLGIVQDHHGELTFESEPNQYTRFYLDLPVDNGWSLDKAAEG